MPGKKSVLKRGGAGAARVFASLAEVPARAGGEFVADCRATLVNYIWVNAGPDMEGTDGPMCSIPLQYIQRAVENANRYPEATFKIWIDNGLVTDSTRFWLASFLYDGLRQQNVEICDLRQIPEYAKSRVFKVINPEPGKRQGKGSVYVRADYARVLVLKHCARAFADKRFLLYSDLDCKDLCLKQVFNTLKLYGIAINDMGHRDSVSHGYIALDTGNRAVMSRMSVLYRNASKKAVAGALGFEAFGGFLWSIYPMFNENMPPIRHYLLPGVACTLPHLPMMRELGVN